MTTPNGYPSNVAADGARVAVQAGTAYVDTITLPGDVQLTVGLDASPEARYRVGVENLRSGNPGAARTHIWDAMMSGYGGSDVLFHWLVAMLSGRTVRHFTPQETDQLRRSRSRYAEANGDAWADGVRLIYRLLDSALPALAAQAGPKAANTDMSLLVKQFEDLGADQRDMLRPNLELFLTDSLQDEMWQHELDIAQSRQRSGGRDRRAWMFFQPVPAKVSLPPPLPERTSGADRLVMHASAWLAAAVAGYLGWELLWNGAFLGLLACAAALAGGSVAAAADLELRFLTRRHRLKGEQFRAPDQPAPWPPGDDLAIRMDKLFSSYFARYAPDKAERERWEAAVAGLRRFHRDELTAVCKDSGIPASDVAWLIRYEVRQLKQRWQDGTLREYQRQLLPHPGRAVARRTGLAILVLGSAWAVATLRAHPLAITAALASSLWAWRCWLHISLERRRYAADSQEHAQRQAAIDEEFTRWSGKLEVRPKDEDMARWLACDQTVLLGMALDHFQLPRSRLTAYAFLEKPGVATRRARIEGGPLRYASYQLTIFLLAEDGVRQVRASLDFTTGTLTIRERTSYRYDAIVSVRVLREAQRGHKFELRLTAGDPITLRVRDTDPEGILQDHDTRPAEDTREPGEAEEDTALDATSMASLLHILERAAGDRRDRIRERERTSARPGNDAAIRGPEHMK